MVEQGNKQVRVDNWGTFFLQRLQVFFAKTDYCDLTLQFDGNVQLKVHRLVMNACTEHFRFLEETCPAIEESTIIMPVDLQSDVIVPIVNFMYTGMLEFHVSLYDKLYSAAELMNITILTKLLDAQKFPKVSKIPKCKPEPLSTPPVKKQLSIPKTFSQDFPNPLPGRKVPVWKRKTAPSTPSPVSTSFPTPQLNYEKWSAIPVDPLADNAAKPTRFEWPEDELPTMSLLDTSFEDISYTSRPLLTKEEEEKVQPNFDDLRNNVELPKKTAGNCSTNSNAVNFKDMEEFAKEQKIRTAMFEDLEEIHDAGLKRKMENNTPPKSLTKKIKINNKENKETTISVESVTSGDVDHTKIVTEILKKYPDLVKKNRNIKLKIMPGNKDTEKKVGNAVIEPPKKPLPQIETIMRAAKSQPPKEVPKKVAKSVSEQDEEGPWTCKKCVTTAGEVPEFVLYYLYRKHMTDVHDEVFDVRLCKYCGCRCNTHNLMLYHMYTRHALKPPSSYNFPKCSKCPYIAISAAKLIKHKELHNVNEMQCIDCQLAFTSAQYLTAHIRITGHYNKPGRVSYDCQYCMKKFQSGITLFSHIKKSHTLDAKRDGIVCFDELDAFEDTEEGEDEALEYIIPELLTKGVIPKDKVKIISNVKVPPNQQEIANAQQSQLVPIETSSEADALNNVATGIATSLGLVDIVVLDENQQYILQQDGQNEQTEFIIPELTHGQPFTGQVITTQDNTVMQQGMIQSSTGDIASTDELVMVLTDHDYPDEQECENPENSNIVVLYSHPVDGQEGQFITSQGNLMVNSQTGMLELRNGSTISTTTASQMIVTNSVDTPIESIEMIQREIDKHATEMKQEPFFEEERKPEIHQLHEQSTKKHQNMPDIHGLNEQDVQKHASSEQASEHSSSEHQIEQTIPHVQTEQSEEPIQEGTDESTEQIQEDKDTSEDNVDGSLDISTEEPMEIDEIEHKTAEDQDESIIEDQPDESTANNETDPQVDDNNKVGNNELHAEDDVFHEVIDAQNENEGIDVPPETFSVQSHDIVLNDNTFISSGFSPRSQNLEEQQSQVQDEGEPMEVDGKAQEHINEVQQDEEEQPENAAEECIQQSEIEAEETNEGDIKSQLPDEPGIAVTQDEEEMQVRQEDEETQVSQGEETQISQGEEDTGPAQEDEDTQSPQEESQTPESKKDTKIQTTEVSKVVEPRKNHTDINKAILDDWEDDTDSQQSEKNVNEEKMQKSQVSGPLGKDESIPTAAENVNKLMDDWDEEDEEEKKE